MFASQRAGSRPQGPPYDELAQNHCFACRMSFDVWPRFLRHTLTCLALEHGGKVRRCRLVCTCPADAPAVKAVLSGEGWLVGEYSLASKLEAGEIEHRIRARDPVRRVCVRRSLESMCPFGVIST